MKGHCFHCGAESLTDKKGRSKAHCGKPECVAAMRLGRPYLQKEGWPTVEGEFVGDFSAHNIRTQVYGRVGLPALRHTPMGRTIE